MRRLLAIPVLILLGFSACDSGTVVSPTAPDLPEASYAKVQVPEFTPPTDCEGCLTGVEILTAPRDTKASVVETATFARSAGASARLVVYAPDPQHTTVKAWLNGVTVLLPSAIARGEGAVEGEDFRFATDLALAADNTLEVRLTGKPGTRIAFWVEGEGEVKKPDGPDPSSSVVFATTTSSVAATADLDLEAECAALTPREKIIDGEKIPLPFVPADWSKVVEVATVDNAGDILAEGLAWIRKDGEFSQFGVPEPYYYVISAQNLLGSVVKIEPDLFGLSQVMPWQIGYQPQRVLCMSLDP